MRASTKYAIVALVIALALIVVFGPALAARLGAAGQQPAPSASGTFKVSFTTGTEYDDTANQPAAGTVSTISADGQSADTYASRADLDDAGAKMVAKFSVI